MPQTPYFYRLRIRNAEDNANVIVVSSKSGDTNPLLTDPPEGDGQNIDPIMGTLEVGEYTWQAVDRFDGGDTYTITSILADADARNQLLSNKCVGEWSTDGSSWSVLHTGYLNDIKLGDAKTYTFIVGDTDRRERDAVLFKTITTTFDKVSNIIGGPVESTTPVAWNGTRARSWGPIIDYGPARFIVIANPSGLVNPTNRVTLSLVGAYLPPLFLGLQGAWSVPLPAGLKWSVPAEYIDKVARDYFEWDTEGLYATNGSQNSQPFGSFPQIEVKLRKVSDNSITRTFPIAQATRKASSFITFPGGDEAAAGDYSALVANSNDWLIVAWDTATMGAQPSVGTTFDAWVRPKVISADNPLHLRGHPIDLHIAANTDQNIAYDATSAAATKTALGDLFYELRIAPEKAGEGVPYADFTEMLKSSAGYGVRYNEDGEQEFFATRAAQPDEVATVTPDDLMGDERGEPKEVIYRVAENSAIKGVDYKLQQFRLWSPKTDSESDRPIDGVIASDLVINGKRRDDSVYGSRIVTYEVPGMILLSGGAFVLNQPLALRDWIIRAGEVIIDRAGWGWIEYEYEVLATVPGKVGEYHDLEAPHQVNAKVGQSPVAQRGGTRKVQIVSRTEQPGTAKIKAKDAGNLAQDPPEATDGGSPTDPCFGVPAAELTLAESTENPNTVATVTLTNVSDFTGVGADLELEYLVQEATPDPTDSGTAFGPLLASTGDDTIDAPAVESGQTIWVRGRAVISATGQLCDWSDWQSLTLGPDDDGTGGELPPFLLALQLDDDGVLSAEATSTVAEITTVYFLAGTPGGSAPLYADVLASSFVDAAGPPFTATGLATMEEGETRTVGAIGEDALGNRTILVTATITRAVNTGSGAGTPGNITLPFIVEAGEDSPLVLGAVPATFTRIPSGRIRANLQNVNSLSGQTDVAVAGPAGSSLDIGYSFDNGASIAGRLSLGLAIDVVRHATATAAVPEEAQDDVLLVPMCGDGDDASDAEIWNFLAFGTASRPPAPIPPIGVFDGLWMSHLETYTDVARTTPVETNGNTVQGWGNLVEGATVHGAQSTLASAMTVDTGTLLNTYRSLRTVGDWFAFTGLQSGATQGTYIIVLQVDTDGGVANGIWNLGAAATDTWYPEGDGVVRDGAGSSARKVVGDLSEDLTEPHVYAVRSKTNQWEAYLDGVSKHATTTNTFMTPGGGGEIGKNSADQGFAGNIWAFAYKAQWLDDDEIAAAITELMAFYGLA